jgi:hypothetical protein
VGDSGRSSRRISEALLQLAGWATGVRLAYETLGEMQTKDRRRPR